MMRMLMSVIMMMLFARFPTESHILEPMYEQSVIKQIMSFTVEKWIWKFNNSHVDLMVNNRNQNDGQPESKSTKH